MQISFVKGTGFSTYQEGTIYFDKNDHLIKVGLSGNTFDTYAGVRSAAWNSTTKVLTIVNQAGENIELNFADVASAEGVNSLLKSLRDDVNKKLDAPTAAGTVGQVLRIKDASGNTEWYSIPAATDYTVSVADSTPTGVLKRYTFSQLGSTIATIDIPKDLVVTSGSCVAGSWSGDTFTEGSGNGHAIKLVIANQTDPVYINTQDLVDIYTAQQNATQVQLAISNDNVISASIVAGSIGATELDASVNASLAKADSAVQTIAEGTANGTIKVDGTDVSVHGLGSAAYLNATSLVQTVTEGTASGSIKVNGTDVSVHGLGSAAYTDSTAYATSAQGTLAASAIQSVTGETAVSNSSYVAVSVEASTNSSTKAVTLTSHANVTTHDVSTAVASSADGLALASDVKAYADSLKEWAAFN